MSKDIGSGSLRVLFILQLIWLVTVCALGAWWGSLLLDQASRISELELLAGVSHTTAHSQLLKTEHMLVWESAAFFLLLLAITIILFWVYFRDLRRSKQLHSFFTGITHELKTPLTSIRLQAESIVNSMQSNVGSLQLSKGSHTNELHSEKLHHLLTRLLEDTSRLEIQIERLLELSRLAGGGAILTQAVPIKHWVDRISNLWLENFSNISIQKEIEDSSIQADSFSLQVILKNLFENSVRHSQCEQVCIQLSGEKIKNRFLLRFQDNGTGFNGDEKKLGELFYKGPRSNGTGVGLFLIRTLMKKMGGQAQFRIPTGGMPADGTPHTGFEAVLWFKTNG